MQNSRTVQGSQTNIRGVSEPVPIKDQRAATIPLELCWAFAALN